MTKPLALIQAPYAVRAGYGDMSRDIIRHLIELGQYEVILISMPWGSCPMNALKANDPKDMPLISRTLNPPFQLPRQPELFIQISVPNEFNKVGKYNIGITAGIETTVCSPEWLEGCNRMDVIWTISEHSKRVFEGTVLDQHDQQSGQLMRQFKLQVPIDVLHNCVDTNIFHKINDPKELPVSVKSELDMIKEDFNFLFVGHWLQGDIGADRKNVGLLIKTFCETFKNKIGSNRPGLIVKTSGAEFSLMDQDEMLKKIRAIRDAVGVGCPNVYLLHGDLSEAEMNGLYNHPKVKVHVSFTKGEGFGRPLLEATQSRKPVIVSGWSGHLDFLNADESVLLGGELKAVDESAVWQGVIMREAQWFNVDVANASRAMQYVMKNYGKLLNGALTLAKKNKDKFGYDTIKQNTATLLEKYVPKFAMPVPMKLPKLRKIGATEE